MREIDLETPDTALPVNTFLIHGDTRSGKTTWAASMPRPLFFSDATEQGWESVRNIDPAFRFESHVAPRVWAIEQANDVLQMLVLAEPLIRSRQVCTLVFDSVSFYVDLMLNFYISMQTKYDARQAYGHLGNHLRDIRVKLHGLHCNVAWLALCKHPDTDDPVGRPLIPGQQADKFCAGVHYIMYSRVDRPKKDGKELDPIFEMRTKAYKNYIAGNRLGGKAEMLPDPLVGTYSDFIATIGYDPELLRNSLPAYAKPTRLASGSSPAAPIAKPPVAAKPTPAVRMITK